MNPVYLLLFVIALFVSGCNHNQSYDQKLQEIYQHTVPVVTADQLENWQTNGEEFVLLDTRSPEEFKVSHLQQSRFLNYENHTRSDLQKFPKDKKIVVYCSVGYRSERVGEKLQQLGYYNVYNLYGGIFGWVNSGRSVYRQGQPTTKIHGYAPRWGKWLNQGDIVYE